MKLKLVDKLDENSQLSENDKNIYKFLEPALKDIKEGNCTIFTSTKELFDEWESL